MIQAQEIVINKTMTEFNYYNPGLHLTSQHLTTDLQEHIVSALQCLANSPAADPDPNPDPDPDADAEPEPEGGTMQSRSWKM